MNTYELTLSDSTWTAEYRPLSMTIAGTGIEAMAREDGSGYDVGDGTLPASGAGDVTGPGGAMYRVAKDADGMLAGTRFDVPMVGNPLTVDAFGGDNPAPKLSADNRDTDANEKGTMLEAVKAKFSMADLLGSGAATATGPNIVANARGEMVKIRDRVAALVDLRRDDGISSEVFADQIDNQWDRADLQIEAIFGGDRMLERIASESRVVKAFYSVVDALSSEEAFAAATLDGGPDQMQGFLTRTAAQAATAFNRNKWTAAARFGAIGSTRFGAAMYNGPTRRSPPTATPSEPKPSPGRPWRPPGAALTC